MNKITSLVMDAVSTLNDENEVVSVNLEMLDEVIKELRSIASETRKSVKSADKDAKEAEKAELAIIGKAYYDSLSVGDEFAFKNASGVEFVGRKIETKSKSGATAAIEIEDVGKRYPKFHQIVVPEWFKTASEVASEDASEEIA